jgi:O-antigen/teichoic acid export membrane protein
MGVSFILIKIYYTFDTVMLGFMKGQAVVGWYNAAYKIVLLFIGFAGLFGSAIYPVLSRCHKESEAELERFVFQFARASVSFGFPIAVGGTMLGAHIIDFVYGPAYHPGVLPLQLLIWSVLTVYFNCSFAFCLLACNRQREYLYSASAGTATNLILNLILIPKYGMVGAGVATVACEVVVLGLILFYSRRVVKALPWAHLLKVFGASSFMGVSLYLLDGSLPLKILAGASVYLAAMIALRGVTRKDVEWLRQITKVA